MNSSRLAFEVSEPPAALLNRPKPLSRVIYDLLAAPLRLALLPDVATEQFGLTSLRAERMAAVLPELRGRVLDVGAGDNLLLRLYRKYGSRLGASPVDIEGSVGIDVHDWGGQCLIVPSTARLPFPDASFDTISFVASLNHIPERRATLVEARRVVRPGGRLLVTMIGPVIGTIGHAIWWYSEDKERGMAEGETGGLARCQVRRLIEAAGFGITSESGFIYYLNRLYLATPVIAEHEAFGEDASSTA